LDTPEAPNLGGGVSKRRSQQKRGVKEKGTSVLGVVWRVGRGKTSGKNQKSTRRKEKKEISLRNSQLKKKGKFVESNPWKGGGAIEKKSKGSVGKGGRPEEVSTKHKRNLLGEFHRKS